MRHRTWSTAVTLAGVVGVVTGAALLASCDPGAPVADPDHTAPANTPAAPRGLDAEGVAAWGLWHEQGWSDYTYRLTVGCFCPAVMDVVVVVRDGRVVKYEGKPLADDQYVTGFDKKQPSIDELFAVLGEAQQDADKVTVDYDKDTGAPTSISIDWISGAIDDEIGYSAERLAPAPPAN